MSGGLNVPNVNAVTVTANSSGFSIAGGSSASKTLTVSNSVTIAGTDSSTLNIGAGGTLQSGAFQVSSQGTTGAQGVQGTTGIQGSVGTQGTLGTQGSTGAQGTVGGAGIQGSTGSQGTGGAQGATGSQGAQGVQGTQGRTGAQGSTGTQGAVGSTGGTGATGSTGVQGTTGATGAQGTSGATILGSANTWTSTNQFNGGLASNGIVTSGTSGGFQNAGYAGGRNRIWSFGNADAYGISYFQNVDSSDWIGMHFGNTTSYNNSQFYVSTGGNTWASTSSRAPIFYDSNNTGYYLDPTSSFNFFCGGSCTFSIQNTSGITVSNPESTGAVVRVGAAYNHPGVYAGGNVYLMSESLVGFRVGDSTKGQFDSSANFWAYGSCRSPIFYDNNDTGYYTDPNGTSNLSSIVVNGGSSYVNGVMRFRSNNGGYIASLYEAPLSVFSDSNNAAYISFHKGGNYAVNFGLDADNVMRIGGWSAASNRWQLDMSGNMTVEGNVTAYSDIRVKENIRIIDNAVEKVKGIRGVYFTRNDQEDKVKVHTGVIAQEVELVLPEVVSEDNLGKKNVAYGNMVGLLIEAIKEQQQQIENQQKQIEELKALINNK